MKTGYFEAKSRLGADFILSDADKFSSVDAYTDLLHAEGRKSGLGNMLNNMAVLIVPVNLHSGSPEALTYFAPFYYGSLLGLRVSDRFSPDLSLGMRGVDLGSALKDTNTSYSQRCGEIAKDIFERAFAGFDAAPLHHSAVLGFEQEVLAEDPSRLHLVSAGYGIVMYLMDEAYRVSQHQPNPVTHSSNIPQMPDNGPLN